MNLREPITNLCGIRDSRERLLGVLPYPPTINDCKHLITSNINRGAIRSSLTPHWRRRRLCGDSRTHPTINNRGAVEPPYHLKM